MISLRKSILNESSRVEVEMTRINNKYIRVKYMDLVLITSCQRYIKNSPNKKCEFELTFGNFSLSTSVLTKISLVSGSHFYSFESHFSSSRLNWMLFLFFFIFFIFFFFFFFWFFHFCQKNFLNMSWSAKNGV